MYTYTILQSIISIIVLWKLFTFPQTKFESEVVQVHDEQKATYEALKASASLLSDTAAAQETFKKFETVSGVIER